MTNITLPDTSPSVRMEKILQRFTAEAHDELLARDCTGFSLTITIEGTAGGGLELSCEAKVSQTESYVYSIPNTKGGSLTRVISEAYRRADVDLGNVLKITRTFSAGETF